MIPTWLPVKEAASTPRSASAMTSRAMEIRSPVLTSMSYSRGGWVALTELARWMRSSVVLPMALTTATTSDALPPCPGDVVGHGPDPVGVADRGAPELLDDQWHPTRLQTAHRPDRPAPGARAPGRLDPGGRSEAAPGIG